jgi:hypothetical protein
MKFDTKEATNRSMDRLMATAQYGVPEGAENETAIVVRGTSGRVVSISMRLSDTQAVLEEMEAGLPCGICHHKPCSWRPRGDA